MFVEQDNKNPAQIEECHHYAAPVNKKWMSDRGIENKNKKDLKTYISLTLQLNEIWILSKYINKTNQCL